MIGFVLFICVFFGQFVDHDFHMSKTSIHYKSDKQVLQFSIHVFTDDLELAISESHNKDLKLFSNHEHPKADSLIFHYLEDVLDIRVNDEHLMPVYLGREMSEDLSGTWIYLEKENLEIIYDIVIDNKLFLEIFNDQKNILQLKVDNKQRAFHILDSDDHLKSIEL